MPETCSGPPRRLPTAGLPRQRFHDLRHCYATLMLEDGEELAVIARTLGHSNISTTADVHAHLTPAMLERSAARMDAILDRHRRCQAPRRGMAWGTGQIRDPRRMPVGGHFVRGLLAGAPGFEPGTP